MAFPVVRSVISQYFVLFQKNFILARRNWKGSIGQLASPIVIVLMLFGTSLCTKGNMLGFQALSDYILSQDQEFPPSSPLGNIPRCVSRNSLPCKTILYAPSDVEWVTSLMQQVISSCTTLSPSCSSILHILPIMIFIFSFPQVASQNNLNFKTDFQSMGKSSNGFFSDNTTLINYIVTHQNTTQNALICPSGTS